MAWIEHRKDRGSYRVWYTETVIDRESGTLKTLKRSQSFSTLALAKRFELQKQNEAEQTKAGLETPAESTLFYDWAKKYVQIRSSEGYPPGTWKQEAQRLNKYFNGKWGARPLFSFQTHEILQYLESLQIEGIEVTDAKGGVRIQKLSPATRNRLRALLHTFWEYAIQRNKAKTNPVSRVPLVEEIPTRKPLRLKSVEQVEVYIAQAMQQNRTYGLLSTILFYGGPRVAEALALKYEDVDEVNGMIRVGRIVAKEEREIVDRTKGQGAGGEYYLPLLDRVRDAIREYRETSHYPAESDFICPNPEGGHLCYETAEGHHKRVMAKLPGFPPITFHDMRRTYASLAEEHGIPREIIKDLLGHSSLTVTKRYTKPQISYIQSLAKAGKFGESKLGNVVVMKKGAR